MNIKQVIEDLNANKVVIVPTDTVWGLAARADRIESVEALYHAKGRDPNKPLSVAFLSMKQVQEHCHLPVQLFKKASQYLPGPYTVVVPNYTNLYFSLNKSAKIGIRIVNTKIINEIIRNIGVPLCLSSANKSYSSCATSIEAAYNIFPLLTGIECDYKMTGIPSDVIDLSANKYLRRYCKE